MIIALSGKSQSGKDTVADYLVTNYNFIKISFGKYLKKCVSYIFDINDYILNSEYKDIVNDEWNVTPREILQWFGTECIRKSPYQHSSGYSIWTHKLEKDLQFYMKLGKNIVISDLRFPDEVEMLKKYKHNTWMIERLQASTLTKNCSEHESENYIVTYDILIRNNDSINDLYKKIEELINNSQKY